MTDNKKFRKNLEKVLDEKNMKQQDLAKAMGVSYQHLNAVLNGRFKLTGNTVFSAAKALGVNAEDLLPKEGLYSVNDVLDQDRTYNLCGIPMLRTRLKDKKKRTTSISEVKAPVFFQIDWLYQKGDPEQMAFVRTNIPCLEGEIPDGSLVMVDMSQTSISDWGVYLVNIDGELLIKRLVTHRGETKIVRKTTDTEQEINYIQTDVLEVVGRCIWYGKDLI